MDPCRRMASLRSSALQLGRSKCHTARSAYTRPIAAAMLRLVLCCLLAAGVAAKQLALRSDLSPISRVVELLQDSGVCAAPALVGLSGAFKDVEHGRVSEMTSFWITGQLETCPRGPHSGHALGARLLVPAALEKPIMLCSQEAFRSESRSC